MNNGLCPAVTLNFILVGFKLADINTLCLVFNVNDMVQHTVLLNINGGQQQKEKLNL